MVALMARNSDATTRVQATSKVSADPSDISAVRSGVPGRCRFAMASRNAKLPFIRR
jgi:hypothetical protein